MKVEGALLKFGEVWSDGTMISKDCKIKYNHLPVRDRFQGLPIGEVTDIKRDEKGLTGTVNLFDIKIKLKWWQKSVNQILSLLKMKEKYNNKSLIEKFMNQKPSYGIGFSVEGREGNIITDCKLHEVSIIRKENEV